MNTPAKASPLATPIIIERICKSRRRDEHVRLELCEFHERPIFNLRIWRTGADGVDRPTERGIAMAVDKLPDVTRALLRAEDKCRELGLINAG